MARFTKLFASSFGLFCMMLFYIILGGFLFQKMEDSGVAEGRQTASVEVNKEIDQFIENVTAIAKNHYSISSFMQSHQTEYEKEVKGAFTGLSNALIIAIRDEGWGGESKDSEPINPWSLSNAILFASTVVTTIGYGHIAPQTKDGQIVCIFYALFGIPITLITLARIGRVFGLVFRIVYYFGNKRFWGFIKWKKGKKNKDEDGSEEASDNEETATEMPDTADKTQNNAGPINSKNNVASNGSKNSEKALSSKDNLEGDELPPVDDQPPPKKGRCLYYKQMIKTFARRRNQARIRVPISISAAALVVYVVIGSILFSSLKKEWTFEVGCYFSFITISTIGFGDFVFGHSETEQTEQYQLVLSFLYIILGLSVNTMIIDLVADELMEKIHKCMITCGLVKADGEDEEDDSDEESDEDAMMDELDGKKDKKLKAAASGASNLSMAQSKNVVAASPSVSMGPASQGPASQGPRVF